MRWKLVIMVSVVAAVVAFCLWEIVITFIFGSVQPVQPHERLLLASALVPLVFALLAGFFVYRHTARRRKTQAILSVLLTLIVAITVYFGGSRLFPDQLAIPRPCDYPCE